MAVAGGNRPAISRNSSAYTAGAGSIAPNRTLRHALFVPRLAAPDCNATRAGPEPEEAVAILVQARGNYLACATRGLADTAARARPRNCGGAFAATLEVGTAARRAGDGGTAEPWRSSRRRRSSRHGRQAFRRPSLAPR